MKKYFMSSAIFIFAFAAYAQNFPALESIKIPNPTPEEARELTVSFAPVVELKGVSISRGESLKSFELFKELIRFEVGEIQSERFKTGNEFRREVAGNRVNLVVGYTFWDSIKDTVTLKLGNNSTAVHEDENIAKNIFFAYKIPTNDNYEAYYTFCKTDNDYFIHMVIVGNENYTRKQGGDILGKIRTIRGNNYLLFFDAGEQLGLDKNYKKRITAKK